MYKVIRLSMVCAIVILSFTLVASIVQAQTQDSYYYLQGYPGNPTSDSQNFTSLIGGYYLKPSGYGSRNGSGAPVNYPILATLCHHQLCDPVEFITYWNSVWAWYYWYNSTHVMFDWWLDSLLNWGLE
jgi:hypothetical protein